MSAVVLDRFLRGLFRAVADAADDLATACAAWAVHVALGPLHRDALRAVALAEALAATADPDDAADWIGLDIQAAECAALGRRLAELVPDDWTDDLAAALADLFDGPPPDDPPPPTAAECRAERRRMLRAEFASRQLAFPFLSAMNDECSMGAGVSV